MCSETFPAVTGLCVNLLVGAFSTYQRFDCLVYYINFSLLILVCLYITGLQLHKPVNTYKGYVRGILLFLQDSIFESKQALKVSSLMKYANI